MPQCVTRRANRLDSLPTRLVGVNTKTYLSLADSRRWLEQLAERSDLLAAAGLFVAVPPPVLPDARALLGGTGIAWAAQNTWTGRGPCTGEVGTSMLAELGCTFVIAGHSERRKAFGEDDASTASKAASIAANAMVPVICVGETGYGDLTMAADHVEAQAARILAAVPDTAPVVIAYTPVWAAGAADAANHDHVQTILRRLAPLRQARRGAIRFMYGGACRPGTFTALAGGEGHLDGVFTARSGLDVTQLACIAAELTDG
ncbi:triose-phosphate isomerase [Phytomonospora endophytica]|nr:triose-phosphate isomerase family protein [Phytomonospora endophytica]